MNHQNPEDIDPNQWLDEGELTELLDIPREEAEERVGNEAEDSGTPKADTGPYLEITINPENPEVVAAREVIHERIQVEIQHEDKEAEVLAEERLDAPPAWNEVPDLMMEAEDGMMILKAATKRKREGEEVAWWPRKRQREDEIRAEKCEHSP